MEKYNIVIVEDHKQDRERLVKLLSDPPYEHKVIAFRDIATLKEGDTKKDFSQKFDESRKTVMIIDIMLAEQLDEDLQFALRWSGEEVPGPIEKMKHVDDELGLKLATWIRKGIWDDNEKIKQIAQNIHILFLTARQNESVLEMIKTIDNSMYLEKPVFVDEVQEAIETLLSKINVKERGA